MKHLLLALLVALSTISFAAEPQRPKPGAEAPATTALAATENLRLREQVLLLTEQLRVTKEFQASLLDAVWWAMTAVVTVGGLLVATNIFAAWRTRESDRQLLLNEVNSSAQKLRVEVLEKANTNSAEIKEKVDVRLEAQSEAMATELRNLRDLISSDRNRATDSINELSKQVAEGKLEQAKASSRESGVVRDLLKLKTEFHELEALVFELQKSHGLRLMAASQSLSSAVEIGIGHYIESRANLIIEIVADILGNNPNFKLNPDTKAFILSQIPEEHPEHGELLARARGAVTAIPERVAPPKDPAVSNEAA